MRAGGAARFRYRARRSAALGAVLAFGGAAASAQPVRLVVHPAPGAACSVHDAVGNPAPDRLSAAPAGFVWARLAGDVLRCDGPGLEPLDVADRGVLPSKVTVNLRPARPVALETEWSGAEAVVEWRAIGPRGTTLLARRRLAVLPRMSVSVADEDRLLRFRSEGRAPVSIFVPAGAAGALRVPRPASGGEIVGRLPPHPIAPQAVVLATPAERREVAIDRGRFFADRGLAPGTYALTPRYRGGVSGRPQTVVVRAEETTELVPLPLVEPGAVVLAAGSDVCRGEDLPVRLRVRRTEPLGEGGRTGASVLDQGIEALPCDRELEGLEPGEYMAALVQPSLSGEAGGLLSTARFQVARGRRTEVRLAPSVFARGRVTIGPDRPAVGLTLLFQLETRSWVATPNEEGEYAVALGDPGEYTITVRARDGVPSAWFNRRLEGRTERADFALSAGELHVRLLSPDGTPSDELVGLVVTGRDGKRITGEGKPGREEVARFAGLDLGEYVITATTPSGLTSQEPATAILSADAPVAEVELVLGRHEGLLTVVDESGTLVETAQVRAGTAPLSPEAPGAYRLDGVSVGERLVLRAEGYVPACRMLRSQDLPNLRHVLTRASETVTIRLAKDLRWESGLLEGLPGSDCPVGAPRRRGDGPVRAGGHECRGPAAPGLVPARPGTRDLPAGRAGPRRRGRGGRPRPRPIAFIRLVAPYPIG